jgi:parallel beta-helix repeat protein
VAATSVKDDIAGMLPPALVLTVMLLSGCGNGVGVNGGALPNDAPQAIALSCAASPTIAVQGTPVQVTAAAVGGQNAQITYSYSTSGGAVTANGSSAILDTTGAAPGTVTVTCKAQAGGAQAVSTAAVTVVAASSSSFYVATNGNDSGDGSAAHPFRTLTRAQAAMEGSAVKTTTLEAGTFYLGNTLKLAAADQGETWKALDGAKVVLSGGEQLAGWQAAGNGIYSTAAAHAVGLDLSIAGVRQTAADLGYDPDRPFITGWRVVAPATVRNSTTTIGVLPSDLTASVKPGAIVQLLSDVRYSDIFTTIVSVDQANSSITVAAPFYDGAASGASWRVLADPADLTVPGQFAYDGAAGRVSVMPLSAATLGIDTVVAAQLSTLISLANVSGITISGLTFSDTVSAKSIFAGIFDITTATISATSVTNSSFTRNAFVNAGNGIGMTDSSGNDISANTFTDMGGSGIFFLGTCSHNTVISNTMTRLGRVNVPSGGVILGLGSSNTVDYNTIDGSGRYGILLYPADDVIANNVIRNINQQTNDTGAIYSWAADVSGWVESGMIITGNRIENTGGLSRDASGNYIPGLSLGIYMDDHVSRATITKNVVESGSTGIFLCHGCDANTADNNLIVMQAPASFSPAGGGSAPATQDMYYNGTMTFDFLPSFFPGSTATSVIVVQLSGDSAGGAEAHFNVAADGMMLGSGTATAGVSDFVFKAVLIPHQHHQITLQLDNGVNSGTPTASLHNIVFFVNNTAVLPQASIVPFNLAGNDDLMVSDFSITHTIMYMNGGHASVLSDLTAASYPNYIDPHPGTIDYNVLYLLVDKASDSIFGSQPLDAHSITADPLFTNPGAGDYTLQANSPAATVGFKTAGMPLAPP